MNADRVRHRAEACESFPLSGSWFTLAQAGTFKQAFYVLESEHIELTRLANDAAATERLKKVRDFKVRPEMRSTYKFLISQAKGGADKAALQRMELQEIAKHEQINVLQPLIYDDKHLITTMDLNHRFSRLTGGWLSPQFKLVFSAAPSSKDEALAISFDPPTGAWNQIFGKRQSLPNQEDRMGFVNKIAQRFNDLMAKQRPYMEGELRMIQGWLNA